MKKLALLIIALTITLSIPPYLPKTGATSNNTAIVYWVVSESKQISNIILGNDWLEFSFKKYENWFPEFIWIEAYIDLDLDELDKIETDGYFLYAVKKDGYNYFTFVNSPGKNTFKIRARGAANIRVKNITIYYDYTRIEKITYEDSGDVRSLKYKIEYEKIKQTFANFENAILYIYWPGSFELTELYDPTGSNILENAHEISDIFWYWNGVGMFLKDLSEKYVVDGLWLFRMKQYDKNSPLIFSYPDIHAYMYLRFKSRVYVTLPAGNSKILEFKDLLTENIPSDWHIGFHYSYLMIKVVSGSADDLEIRDTFYVSRYGQYFYCDLYKNGVSVRNTGSSTIKLYVETILPVFKELSTSTSFDENNKSIIKIDFEVPPVGALPFSEIYDIRVIVYHSGLWKPGNLYAPNGKLVQDIIAEESPYFRYGLFPIYSLTGVGFYLLKDTAYFAGKWKYTAYAPSIYVEDSEKSAKISPPHFTEYIHEEDNAIWAHYSIGEEAKFYIEKAVKQINPGTRVVFTGWKGYGGGFDSEKTFGNVKFEDSIFVKEVATWSKEYLLNVQSKYGKASGGGWYKEGERAIVEIGETEISPTEGVKYVFTGWSGDATGKNPKIEVLMDNPKEVKATWKTQYYVKIVSEYGSVSGEGWYDEGSAAIISVSPTEIGFPIKNVFKHWLVNGQPMRGSTISIIVDNPVLAVAVWEKDYTILIVIGVALIGLAILIIIMIFLRRRKKAPYYYPPPPPPPPP